MNHVASDAGIYAVFLLFNMKSSRLSVMKVVGDACDDSGHQHCVLNIDDSAVGGYCCCCIDY